MLEKTISLRFFSQNRISSECCHKWESDILACQISGHDFHVLSSEYPEMSTTLSFLVTRGLKLGQYWPKKTNFWRWSGYTNMPHFRPFLPCILFKMPRNPNLTKSFGHRRPNVGRYQSKYNNSWRWSRYINMPHFRLFLPCVLLRMFGNLTGQMDRLTYICKDGWTDVDQSYIPSDFVGRDERERLSLSAFWGTADIGVHIVHISHVIITYTLE